MKTVTNPYATTLLGRAGAEGAEALVGDFGYIEGKVTKLGMVGGFGPRMFAGDTEHRGDRVIPKRDKRALVLPAGTGDVDVAVDENIGVSGHPAPRVLW